eukprot:TRINITY_DN106493_c0_g1_i1.p1 TRINITY_DN106493_c0_g1~~TRINITY_DN106493_c0_g1_i1.p1  ORF type:complete len:523 (+),score=102.04 TRINITY_DN106493_c0_g1_i1:29-1597(+)
MPAMFMDTYFSAQGRATAMHLTALRKQLGVGTDPCFDYSALENVGGAPDAQDEKPAYEQDLGGMDKLRMLLHEVAGHREELHEDDALDEGLPKEPSVMTVRKQRELSRPSSAFKNRSRSELERLDVAARPRAPGPGTYRPEQADHCLAAFGRVKKPPDKTGTFGIREKHRSRKLQESDEPTSTEVQEEVPEPAQRKQVCHVDMARQMPRPDLTKSAGIVFHESEASDPEGVQYGHERCAAYGHFYRQPCFDWQRMSKKDPKVADSYGEPGQYEAAKPKTGTGTLPFEARPARKDLNQGSYRCTDHLPDRSLARDCPNITKFGRLVAPPIKVPDLAKYTDRPPLIVPGCQETHDENDPHIDEIVMHHKLTFDAHEAAKVMTRRARSASDFSKGLTRQQELQSRRIFGQDICYSLAKDNVERGPTSTEVLEGDMYDRPALQCPVQTFKFELMPGGAASKKHSEPSARGKDMSSAARFQRVLRSGETVSQRIPRPKSAVNSSRLSASQPVLSSRPRSANSSRSYR